MNATVHILFHLLLHMACFGVFEAGLSDAVKQPFFYVKNPPKWLEQKLQNLHAQEVPEPIKNDRIFTLPTFFGRRNKDGKIVNAFDRHAWLEIRSRPSGNII